MLESGGGAIVLLEQDASAKEVYAQVRTLLSDGEKSRQMSTQLKKLAVADSADRICMIAEKLAAKKKN